MNLDVEVGEFQTLATVLSDTADTCRSCPEVGDMLNAGHRAAPGATALRMMESVGGDLDEKIRAAGLRLHEIQEDVTASLHAFLSQEMRIEESMNDARDHVVDPIMWSY